MKKYKISKIDLLCKLYSIEDKRQYKCKEVSEYIDRLQGIKDNQEYDEALYEILDEYTNKNWKNETLDGDEVDRLTEFLRAKLNLINGNITQEEYNKLFD